MKTDKAKSVNDQNGLNSTQNTINTTGGAYIDGNVDTKGGTFIGRDVKGDFIVGPIIKYIFMGKSEKQSEKSRADIMKRVQDRWIKGVLNRSLFNEIYIPLEMETRSEVVVRPWDMVLQRQGHKSQPLPKGASIIEVFEKNDRALLILGEPGSGKTTILLDLARELIASAQGSEDLPIPVVFNLSSWSEPYSLDEWLVEELASNYHISLKIARQWVENDELSLLLDGLDEVADEQIEACVEMINRFRHEHGGTSLAICSRVKKYEALKNRLNIETAVYLLPLTPSQIDDYLDKLGADYVEVKQLLHMDTELHEIARSPLMLNVIILSYAGIARKDQSRSSGFESLRGQIFDAYITQMFKRRRLQKNRYDPKQTLAWLAWLAQKMVQHRQKVFQIELLQPSWLQNITGTQFSSHFYNILDETVFNSLFALLQDSPFRVFRGMSQKEDIKQEIRWSKGRVISELLFGLVVGLIGWLIIGLLILWISPQITHRRIDDPFFLLFWILQGGILYGLIFGATAVLSHTAIKIRIIPIEGIRQSARNALNVGLLVGTLLGILSGLCLWLLTNSNNTLKVDLQTALFLGLVPGILAGLSAGFSSGGLFVALHYILRLLLAVSGYFPWKAIAFLDYATSQTFLRKVGNGYIFIHDMLMEHFANLNEDKIEAIVLKLD